MHALFWRACNAYSEYSIKKAMEKIEKEAGGGRGLFSGSMIWGQRTLGQIQV